MDGCGSLLGLRGMGRAEIESILDRADDLLPVVDGERDLDPVSRTAVFGLVFLEDSTRTRLSFETAVHRLGHRVISMTTSGSSTSKGETLVDTARNIAAMGVQGLVVRCGRSGGAARIADAIDVPVVNAGDGRHEHPTQGLLDASALRARLGTLEGRRILIVGDIGNSRVARSDTHCLLALGASVTLVGPPGMVPWHFASLGEQVVVSHELDPVLDRADAVITLRIQRERSSAGIVASDYRQAFGLTAGRSAQLRPDVPILHPGPANRGVEIDDEVLEDPDRSLVLDQVRRGVAVRMAVLERLLTRSSR